MRAYRQARLVTERVKHVAEDEVERELQQLDDDTAGTNHDELSALREAQADGEQTETEPHR